MFRVCLLIIISVIKVARSQVDIGYQKPPDEIFKLVDINLPPRVLSFLRFIVNTEMKLQR